MRPRSRRAWSRRECGRDWNASRQGVHLLREGGYIPPPATLALNVAKLAESVVATRVWTRLECFPTGRPPSTRRWLHSASRHASSKCSHARGERGPPRTSPHRLSVSHLHPPSARRWLHSKVATSNSAGTSGASKSIAAIDERIGAH
jgi:hypothetical protein